MEISIITINYNNKIGLLKTIESVRSQNTNFYEYIVVDGNSNDGSKDVILNNNDIITYWVSEEDSGIYNAMNKGVKLASGDYCIFMNSGDVFYSKNVINSLLKLNFNEDYILGSVISGQIGIIKGKKYLTMADFVFGSIAHQASIIKRTILLKYPYDENLKIVADWKFCIQTLIFKECTYKSIDLIIAKEEPDGISAKVSENHKIERDTVLKGFLPKKVLKDYDFLKITRKKPFNWLINYFTQV